MSSIKRVAGDNEDAAKIAKEIRSSMPTGIDQETYFQGEMWGRGLDNDDALWYMVHKILFPKQHTAPAAVS